MKFDEESKSRIYFLWDVGERAGVGGSSVKLLWTLIGWQRIQGLFFFGGGGGAEGGDSGVCQGYRARRGWAGESDQ